MYTDRLLPIEHGEAAAGVMPNARLWRIQGAGHLPLMDRAGVFNELVVGFLDGRG